MMNINWKLLLGRYRFFLTTIGVLTFITVINPAAGSNALGIVGYSLKEMMMVIPPIFILLGLLDVWIPKETMIKYMGEQSGLKGIVLAFLMGSAAAGPLYGAFPFALVLMKKEVKFSNILIFIGAWSTTKIPMFLFEMTALGGEFAFTRLLINIPGIIILSYLLDKLLVSKSRESIYRNIELLEA